MGTLATAPGVLGAALTTYVTADDVVDLLGCRYNKAYETIRAINEFAIQNEKFAYEQGKASKYILADKFGIPMDVVNAVIEKNKVEKQKEVAVHEGDKQDRQQKGGDEHRKQDPAPDSGS